MANVDITIRDNETGVYYRIPVLPSEIAYSFGDAVKDTVKVIDLGNVDFHSGKDLDSFGWSSFFPARYDPAYCTTSDMLTPLEYQRLFTGWKDRATSLQVICPAADINVDMTLNSFRIALRGFELDIYYQVTFRERRVIKPIQMDLGATTTQNTKAGPENRNPVPQQEISGTYTVKAGDTLTSIAKAYGISPWDLLYTKNKAIIGPDPNKIIAGQVLTLPTSSENTNKKITAAVLKPSQQRNVIA